MIEFGKQLARARGLRLPGFWLLGFNPKALLMLLATVGLGGGGGEIGGEGRGRSGGMGRLGLLP